MSSQCSSEQFGKEMGQGWKKGVQTIFQNNVKVVLECGIKKCNGARGGNIDIAFEFKKEAVNISEFFPKNIFLRPDVRHKNSSSLPALPRLSAIDRKRFLAVH